MMMKRVLFCETANDIHTHTYIYRRYAIWIKRASDREFVSKECIFIVDVILAFPLKNIFNFNECISYFIAQHIAQRTILEWINPFYCKHFSSFFFLIRLKLCIRFLLQWHYEYAALGDNLKICITKPFQDLLKFHVFSFFFVFLFCSIWMFSIKVEK